MTGDRRHGIAISLPAYVGCLNRHRHPTRLDEGRMEGLKSVQQYVPSLIHVLCILECIQTGYQSHVGLILSCRHEKRGPHGSDHTKMGLVDRLIHIAVLAGRVGGRSCVSKTHRFLIFLVQYTALLHVLACQSEQHGSYSFHDPSCHHHYWNARPLRADPHAPISAGCTIRTTAGRALQSRRVPD